jgi:hypothetical protein
VRPDRFASLIVATAAVLAAGIAPSAASSRPAFQPPVPGVAQGVTASVAGRTVTIRFTGAAAAAGRKLPGLMFATPPETRKGARSVTAAADGTLTAELAVTGDGCEVSRDAYEPVARVGLTPAGEAWADEINAGTALLDAAYLGRPGRRYTPAVTLVARGAGRIVALAGPDATPPPGQVGYWTDGDRHAAFVALSAAGRRLVWEDLDGRVHRSNVNEAYYDYAPPEIESLDRVLASDDRERGVKRYAGHTTMVEALGLRASVTGGRVILRFTGESAQVLRAIAGHRVTAFCQALPASSRPLLGAPPSAPVAVRVIRVPRHGDRLRFPRMAARDVCQILDDGFPVALAWPSAVARRAIADYASERRFFAATGRFDLGVLPGATAYPSAAAVVASRPSMTALATPDATPRRGVLGLWTDGGRQAELVRVGADGRRLFVADEGDGVLRTDMIDGASLAWAAGVA